MLDLARLDRICAGLSAADAAWLRDQLEPPWLRRQRRLAERDALIRELAEPYITLGSGRAMARELRRALVRRSSSSAVCIIELSGGRVPSDRVIRDVLSGQDSPLDSAHDAPEPRRRLGGTGTPCHECLAYVVHYAYGVPTSWIKRGVDTDLGVPAIDPANPPIYESEGAYLERLSLLLPGERRQLLPVDFEPQSVIEILGLDAQEPKE